MKKDILDLTELKLDGLLSILDPAENRLHAQKALMLKLLKVE